jgi:predicted HTH domain antitoxin
MPLTITDEQLRTLGMSEREAGIEFACRMYEAGKVELWPAAQMAGLTRAEMEGQLRGRGIAIYSPSVEEFEQDMRSLEQFRRGKRAS